MPVIEVYLLPTAGLDAAAVAPWCVVLDAAERARAARFAMERARVGFIAAHVLARLELAAALGIAPAALAFVAGSHGKPEARLAGRAAGISFSLSHAEGMVGVALAVRPDLPLGFDLERRTRRIRLEVAQRFFAPREVADLREVAEARRAERLVRLWTLKEAFVKATGEGIAAGLAGFGFAGRPPRLFLAPPREAAGEREAAAWRFAQRVVAGCVAAVGARLDGEGATVRWHRRSAAGLERRLGRYARG